MKQQLNIKNCLDDDLLVDYANLRSQSIELQSSIQKEGYRKTNVNSRGKETHQTNPTYRAYISCISEKNKYHSKIKKMLPGKLSGGDDSDGFDDF